MVVVVSALRHPSLLVKKFRQYRKEEKQRKTTEKELRLLNAKIEQLLAQLDDQDLCEPARSPEEECVVCISSRATMQTFPCGHRVVCRKCFVRTIQTAVAQRMLPLRCAVCRERIERLRPTPAPAGTAPRVYPPPPVKAPPERRRPLEGLSRALARCYRPALPYRRLLPAIPEECPPVESCSVSYQMLDEPKSSWRRIYQTSTRRLFQAVRAYCPT